MSNSTSSATAAAPSTSTYSQMSEDAQPSPSSSSSNTLETSNNPRGSTMSTTTASLPPPKTLSLSVKMQKKFASQFASKRAMKLFVDENTARILDNLYRLVKRHCGSKKFATNVVKDLMKVNMKVIVLYYNGVLRPEEVELCRRLQDLIHDFCEFLLHLERPASAMKVTGKRPCSTVLFPPLVSPSSRLENQQATSSVSTKHPLNAATLQQLCGMMDECGDLCLRVIHDHLTDNSKQKLQRAREFFMDTSFYSNIFSGQNPEFNRICAEITDDLQELMDRGVI